MVLRFRVGETLKATLTGLFALLADFFGLYTGISGEDDKDIPESESAVGEREDAGYDVLGSVAYRLGVLGASWIATLA